MTEYPPPKSALLPPMPHQFVNPYQVRRKCIVTSQWHTVTVETADWVAYRAHLDPLLPCYRYFPYCSDGDCEFILSGLSPLGAEQLHSAHPQDDDDTD